MGILTNKYLVFLLRVGLGLVFIYAAYGKMLHPYEFAKSIYYYKMLPGEVINLFAILLPPLELLTGVLLVVGYWQKAATWLIGGMLVMFLIALFAALARGIDIDCGCFSTASRAKGSIWEYIIRDIIMLVACVLILASRESFLSLDQRFRAAQ